MNRVQSSIHTQFHIQVEDLEDADTRTELQKELEAERVKRDLLEEQVGSLQNSLKEKNKMDEFIFKFLKGLMEKGKSDEIIQFIKDENLDVELSGLAK